MPAPSLSFPLIYRIDPAATDALTKSPGGVVDERSPTMPSDPTADGMSQFHGSRPWRRVMGLILRRTKLLTGGPPQLNPATTLAAAALPFPHVLLVLLRDWRVTCVSTLTHGGDRQERHEAAHDDDH